MDAEEESAAYLHYLNESALLSNNVELGDAFPFSEIESSDWQTETFPVLVNATEDIQLFNGETLVQSDNLNETIIVTQADEDEVETTETLSTFLQNDTAATANNLNAEEISLNTPQANQKTYVNYSPIVKENPDGNKEIYLTEEDINNDASIIQLFNTDGSVITIDKALLSSINIPKQNGTVIRREIRNYESHFTPLIAYKCKSCSQLFDSEAMVKDHLDSKHPELFQQNGPIVNGTSILNTYNNPPSKKYKIYLCSICKSAFSEMDRLKQHMIDNHKLGVTQQPAQTDTNTGQKNTLSSLRALLVQQQQKARKKVVCSIEGCKVKFPREDLCKKHEECHIGQNKKQFKCLVCEEKFSIWRICSNHLWKCHKIDMGLLNCPMCGNFKSNSAGRLMNHMALHNEERPFLCKHCGKSFKSQVQVRNHEVSHLKSDENPNKVEKLPSWSIEKWCHLCERYFASSKSLKMHIRSVHEHFKPFICCICGHKTTRKSMLELHIRQHTGSRPHQCPYCEYKAGDQNCLKKHLMKHVGSWNYKCPHCPYTSIQSASYKTHIKNKHPGKDGTYNCTTCTYTSINYENYQAHLKKHETSFHQNRILENQANIQVSTMDVEDDETQTLFNTDQTVEETIDTGGITIPADLDTPNS